MVRLIRLYSGPLALQCDTQHVAQRAIGSNVVYNFYFRLLLFLLQRVISLILFFFLFSCIACWAKSPILHFRACSVFYFFVGGSFFDREYEEGGDVRGCRHLVFFSYFFFFLEVENTREKKEKMISLSNVTSDWARKDGLRVIQHSEREREKSPQLKRSADGSG